ncbi:MAG: chromate efflux transporter [Myxococcales bacterium]|nr:chromate efflux transporter [Myxococcales bacterium]
MNAPSPPHAERGSVGEVALAFAHLGCTSFGGPIAHIGYFREAFVARRAWIDDDEFAELVALCQFLPGPASSQLVFALGLRRAGLVGAIVASLCFTAPSAALMIAFAYGVARAAPSPDAGWLHGLKLAAVAVVAQAVWAMGQKLCTDRARITLCVVAAAALLVWPGALAQLSVLSLGAIAGWALDRDATNASTTPSETRPSPPSRWAALALAVFALSLVALPSLARATGSRDVLVFDAFYRAGSLVFGGGHVVLPLLRAEVVPRGWLTEATFVAGYGAAQAVPGPLFTFSAFVGASMNSGHPRWAYGLYCLLAIFAPAWLLIAGALPFWSRIRAKRWARGALSGANATVVGLLLAALYRPVFTESVRDARDVAVVLLAFVALERWKAPPWLVVVACSLIGQLLLAR